MFDTFEDLRDAFDKFAAADHPVDLARFGQLVGRVHRLLLEAERDSESVAVVDSVDVEERHTTAFIQRPAATPIQATRPACSALPKARRATRLSGAITPDPAAG